MITLRFPIIVIKARILPIIASFIGFALSAAAEPSEPPVRLDCTIRYWNEARKKQAQHDDGMGYSTTKVAPKDIAWLRPGANPVGRQTHGFVVLGSCNKGNLMSSTDIRKLMTKLSKVASDHRANAISYEKYGTEVHFQFLRVKDAFLTAAKVGNKTIARGRN